MHIYMTVPHYRVQPCEGIPEAPLQHNFAVVSALGRQLARRDLESMLDGVAEAFEPGEGGVFDDGLGECAHRCVPLLACRSRYSRSVKPPSSRNDCSSFCNCRLKRKLAWLIRQMRVFAATSAEAVAIR